MVVIAASHCGTEGFGARSPADTPIGAATRYLQIVFSAYCAGISGIFTASHALWPYCPIPVFVPVPDQSTVMLEYHSRSIAHFSGGPIFVFALREEIRTEGMP